MNYYLFLSYFILIPQHKIRNKPVKVTIKISGMVIQYTSFITVWGDHWE